MRTVVLQTTTFSSHGGIQTYNRLFCRALNQFSYVGDTYILIGTDYPDDIAAVRESEMYKQLRLEAFSQSRVALIRRVILMALKFRIDLLLVGHINYAPLAAIVKLIQPTMKYGVVIHGKDVWLRQPYWRRYALRKADFVLTVSLDTQKQAERVNGPLCGRSYLLPNALQWDAEASSPMGPTTSSGLRLLSVGRLADNERQKGIDTVIEALPRIIDEVPEVQYTVIGEGTDLARLRRLAVQVGVADRVHFLGSVNDTTLKHWYEACDIFVLPSAQEGFGIVFLEAMRYRKPVVAARFGGAPEVVLDGATGLLVNYGDVDQVVKTITLLYRSPELRMQFGQAGYERLQQNFTFPQFRERLDQILMRELPA